MHRCTRPHLRWFYFSISYTLLQFLLCNSDGFVFITIPANSTANPTSTAANATNQQATPTTNHPAGNPAMDQQQREANAALNQAQQERANPQVF